MSSTDLNGTRNIVTAAATADVDDDRPAICGSVTLHCIDNGEPLRLVMPMVDAMLLLNSLREIEAVFGLQGWATRLGCSLNVVDRITEELSRQCTDMDIEVDNDDPEPSPTTIN